MSLQASQASQASLGSLVSPVTCEQWTSKHKQEEGKKKKKREWKCITVKFVLYCIYIHGFTAKLPVPDMYAELALCFVLPYPILVESLIHAINIPVPYILSPPPHPGE